MANTSQLNKVRTPKTGMGTRVVKYTPGEFRKLWLSRFDFQPATWEEEMRAKVQELPFAARFAPLNTELLLFLFQELPGLLVKSSATQQQMAMAYGWCCFQFWQSLNGFPAYSHSYACYLRDALRKHSSFGDPTAMLITDLLGTARKDGTCGLNRLVWQTPKVAKNAERITQAGTYEEYLSPTGRVKYQEYSDALLRDPGFQRDWSQIKAAFPGQTIRDITRRTLMPERHWVKDGGAHFTTEDERFQSTFNLFCWKYYLWAMMGDVPLLQKPSVNITPYGTQIFIPGYMSFDPKRDFDKVTKLHRCRGVIRQGKAFSLRKVPKKSKVPKLDDEDDEG